MRALKYAGAVLLASVWAGAQTPAMNELLQTSAKDGAQAPVVRAPEAAAAEASNVQPAPPTPARALLDKSRADLETLYKNSPSGPIPDGESNGRAAVFPGTPAGKVSEALFSVFWHGKVFDSIHGELVNRLVIGRAVKAKVFIGPSWFDGKPSVIIDYKGTSWLAGAIRDEIRLVAPGTYLGFAYVRAPDGGAPRADIMFALDFDEQKPK